MRTHKPYVQGFEPIEGIFRWIGSTGELLDGVMIFETWFEAMHYVYLQAYGIHWQPEAAA